MQVRRSATRRGMSCATAGLTEGDGIDQKARLGGQRAEDVAFGDQTEPDQHLTEARSLALLSGEHSAQLVLVDDALFDQKLA